MLPARSKPGHFEQPTYCPIGCTPEKRPILARQKGASYCCVISSQPANGCRGITTGVVQRAGPSQVGLNRGSIAGPAQFGESLEVAGLPHASSTFGGFVELKSPRTGQWLVFGLTCYHCVVPPAEECVTMGLIDRELPVNFKTCDCLFHMPLDARSNIFCYYSPQELGCQGYSFSR